HGGQQEEDGTEEESVHGNDLGVGASGRSKSAEFFRQGPGRGSLECGDSSPLFGVTKSGDQSPHSKSAQKQFCGPVWRRVGDPLLNRVTARCRGPSSVWGGWSPAGSRRCGTASPAGPPC